MSPERPWRVLLAHGRYRIPGGEETSVDHEAALLEQSGHAVVRYELENQELEQRSRAARLATTVWNRHSHRDVRDLIRTHSIDVLHVHNWFGQLSPSVYYAARAGGVAVVQTLHNFRLVCVNGLLVRDEQPCELCVGRRLAWPGIRYGCFGDSRSASAAVALGVATHRLAGTWDRLVDQYTVPSETARRRLVRGGLPSERVHVRPNYLAHDPGPGPGDGGYLVFVGRLASEKGVDVLLEAWEQMNDAPPLVVVGDGPLRRAVEQADQRGLVEWVGWQPPERVLDIVGAAEGLVMPSVFVETFGRTALEAYAKGTPVIASATGALTEMVDDRHTGRLVPLGDPHALAEAVRWLWSHPRRGALRLAARRTYEDRFSPGPNLERLLDIYRMARARSTTAHRT